MSVRLTFVRHGETELNADGKLRGWLDVRLNAVGKQQAADLAPRFHYDSRPILSSDLLRAAETAHSIQGWLKPKVTVHRELRPWHVGVFAGRPADQAHKQLLPYIESPDRVVPFGESWNQYLDRYLGFLESLREDAVVVSHFRNCKVASAWRGGRQLCTDTLLRDDLPLCVVFDVVL